MLHTVGEIQRLKDMPEQAEASLRRALDVMLAAGPSKDEELPESLSSLGAVLCDRGDDQEAIPLFEGAVRLRRGLAPVTATELRDDLISLASAKERINKVEEAEAILNDALSLAELEPSSDKARVDILIHLANLYGWDGKYYDAQDSAESALSLSERLFG